MTILSIIYTPRDESTCNTVAKYVWGFLKLETREPGLIKKQKGWEGQVEIVCKCFMAPPPLDVLA